MTSDKIQPHEYLPSGIALAICLLLGAGFSAVLYLKLGIDIESAELLHYVLVTTPVLMALLIATMLVWSLRIPRQVFIDGMVLSASIWIPFEALAYVISAWGLRGWQVFAASNLPFFLMLLVIWSTATGLVAAMMVLVLRQFFPNWPPANKLG
jgi:hypothetical protein